MVANPMLTANDFRPRDGATKVTLPGVELGTVDSESANPIMNPWGSDIVEDFTLETVDASGDDLTATVSCKISGTKFYYKPVFRFVTVSEMYRRGIAAPPAAPATSDVICKIRGKICHFHCTMLNICTISDKVKAEVKRRGITVETYIAHVEGLGIISSQWFTKDIWMCPAEPQ